MLEISMLHRGRPEVKLVQFGTLWEHPAKDGAPQETFWGYNRGGCVAVATSVAVEVSK
jgi:hypothetical protein